jgi:hypothetical protein
MEIIGADREKNKEVLRTEKKAKTNSTDNKKKRRLGNYVGHILHRNCLLKYVTEGKKYKWREDEEEEVSSYWVALNKREDNGI